MDLMQYLDHHFIDLYLTPDPGTGGLEPKGGADRVTDDELVRMLRKSLPKAKGLFTEQQVLLLEQEALAQQKIGFDPLSCRHEQALERSLHSLDSLQRVSSQASEQLKSRADSQKSLHLLKDQLTELTCQLQKQRMIIAYFKRVQVYQELIKAQRLAEASKAAYVLKALQTLECIQAEFLESSRLYRVGKDEDSDSQELLQAGGATGLQLSAVLDELVERSTKETQAYLEKRVGRALKHKGWLKDEQKKAEVTVICVDYAKTVLALSHGSTLLQPSSQTELSRALVEPFVRQIEQRFRYHFSGNRKTNQVDRPEWFMVYAMDIFKEHEQYLRTELDVALRQLVKQETMLFEGLVEALLRRCVFWRLERSFKTYTSSDTLFCHVVDELISFTIELKETFALDLSQTNTNPLSFVTANKERLKRWVRADFVNAMKQVETILSNTNAWQSGLVLERSAARVEASTKRNAAQFVPESCVDILALVKKCAARFLNNLEPEDSAIFVFHVQLSILSTYRQAIADKIESANEDEREPMAVGLNALFKLSQVLEEWSRSSRYARVYQYQQQTENTMMQSRFDLLGETVGKSKALVQGSTKRFGALLASAMRKRVDKEEVAAYSARSGVFASELVEIDKLYQNTIEQWTTGMFQRFRAIWRSDAATEALEGALANVRFGLEEIQHMLLSSVAEKVVKGVAMKISTFIVDSTIDGCKFTREDAARLEKNCAVLFDSFSLFSRKPGNRFFRRLKETVMILSLPTPKLVALQEALRSLGSTPAEMEQVQSVLEDGYQIVIMARDDVLALSLQRLD